MTKSKVQALFNHMNLGPVRSARAFADLLDGMGCNLGLDNRNGDWVVLRDGQVVARVS